MSWGGERPLNKKQDKAFDSKNNLIYHVVKRKQDLKFKHKTNQGRRKGT